MDISEKILRAKTDYDEVHAAGRQSEYNAFCDAMQRKGARIQYNYAFADTLLDEHTLNPKHIVQPETAEYMFSMARANSPLTLKADKFDFSNCTSMKYAFGDRNCISTFELVDISKCTDAGSLTNAFYDGYNTRVKKKINIKCSENSRFNTNMFGYCTELKDLSIDGTVGMSINLSWSEKLSLESAKNVLTALKDFTGLSEFSCSISLSGATWDLLDADGATSPNGNTWREYVADKKWNE